MSTQELIGEINWSDKTVLIVEDIETSSRFFKAAIQATGASLETAITGKEAVDKFKELPNVDLILMDIRMPEMDGLEATRIIKSIKPDVPIIVQTAFVLSGERVASFKSGCDDFMTKPIKLEVLLKTMKKYLG
jgi:two-component system cell cycle response regulator DivK